MAKRQKPDASDLVGRDGALALTFVNTGSRRPLRDYRDFLAWSERYGGLAPSEARRLEARAAERPDDAASGFAVAEELRSLLSPILNALADRKALSSDPRAAVAVDGLNVLVAEHVPRLQLFPGRVPLRWEWPTEPDDDFTRPIWPVALSATDLLTSLDARWVRRCANDDCGVLFVAKGRGSPRKWCSMETCGNRVRSRQYYHRVTRRRKR